MLVCARACVYLCARAKVRALAPLCHGSQKTSDAAGKASVSGDTGVAAGGGQSPGGKKRKEKKEVGEG